MKAMTPAISNNNEFCRAQEAHSHGMLELQSTPAEMYVHTHATCYATGFILEY